MFRAILIALAVTGLLASPATAHFDFDLGPEFEDAVGHHSDSTAGAADSLGYATDLIWQDIQQVPAPGNIQASVRRTYRTSSQGWDDVNGPALRRSGLELLAPASINNAPLSSCCHGSSEYGYKPYRGPYARNYKYRNWLPPVSTGCIDISMASKDRAPSQFGGEGSGADDPRLPNPHDPNRPNPRGGSGQGQGAGGQGPMPVPAGVGAGAQSGAGSAAGAGTASPGA
jgi:hypothetical protein